MGIKNQKVMSDEEKKAIIDGTKKSKVKKSEEAEMVEAAKMEIVEEAKKDLPLILQTKNEEIAEKLSKTKKVTYTQAYNIIASKNPFAVKMVYTNDELHIAFTAFKEIVAYISENKLFVPTLSLFCAYIGVSTSTFKGWLTSTDETRREVVKMIDDYISDCQLTMAQMRSVDGIVSIFRSKAEHGMTEAVAPTIIEHRTSVNREEILGRIKRAKGEVIEANFKEK